MQKNSKKLHNFYRSKKWTKLRDAYYLQKLGKCENCGELVGMGQFNVHHKIELNDNNVDDPTISLNQKNLILLCVNCHNIIHNRFKKNEDRVLFDKKGNVIWR